MLATGHYFSVAGPLNSPPPEEALQENKENMVNDSFIVNFILY